MIEGNRLRLWSLEKFDVARNYHWANDPELVHLTGMSPYPRAMLDIERWYEAICTSLNLKLFAIKTLEGEYIGNIEISDIDWRCGRGEIGVLIGERAWHGQGYGSEAINLMLDFAFGQMRLHRVEARVLAHNTRARHTFERCGFIQEGIDREAFFSNGAYASIVRFSLLDSDPRPAGKGTP